MNHTWTDKISRRVTRPLWLAALLALAACGGGGSGNPLATPAVTATTTSTTTTTAPIVVASADFIARAQAQPCSDIRNRLFLIDGKQVFAERIGNCADNSYARELYGNTPELLLCGQYDSIVGPVRSCKDGAASALFDLILANLDQADLGLGPAHRVEPIAFPPAEGVKAFASIEQSGDSAIVSTRNVAIRDAASWAALWAEHHGAASLPLPVIDFSKKMVLGVFLGTEPVGCFSASIDKVTQIGNKLVVQYTEKDASATCLLIVGAKPAAPMHLVLLDRSDALVDFEKSRNPPLDTPSTQAIDGADKLLFAAPAQIVVRDSAAWAALWAAHQPGGAALPLPAIDFSRAMVVGVALGTRPGPCVAVDIANVLNYRGQLTVDYTVQDNTAVCNPTPDAAGKPTYPVKLLLVAQHGDGAVVFNPVPPVSAAFSTIDASVNSAIASEQTLVIKDAASWAALWAAHTANQPTPPALPAVDFSRQMVVAAFLGTRPSGCYATAITRVLPRTGRYAVMYTSTAPTLEAACVQAVTAPAHMVLTDRSDAAPDFVRQ